MPTDHASLMAGRCAVLFVECQNGMLGRESAMRTIAEAAQPAIPAMARLAEGARRAGAVVAHLTFAPAVNARTANRRSPLLARLSPRLETWEPDGPETQPIPEIGLHPGDLVFARRSGISPLHGTEVLPVLRNMAIDTVILAGISLNIALPVSAAQAADENFAVIVASDAAVGSPPALTTAVLEHGLPFIARVATVDEILAELDAG